MPELRRHVRMMVPPDVYPFALEPLQRRNLLRRDEPAPDVAEFALRPRQADIDFFDDGACFLERQYGLVDNGGHAFVDRKDPIVARVGKPLARDRGTQRAHEIDIVIDDVGIAGIVTGERTHCQSTILDRARDGPLKDEWNVAAESIGPRHERYASEGRLVSVDATPGRRDPYRPATVGPLAQRQ